MTPPPGRAATDDQKRALLDQLLTHWQASPHQRLGQFLENATRHAGVERMFYVEDDALMRLLANFTGELRR